MPSIDLLIVGAGTAGLAAAATAAELGIAATVVEKSDRVGGQLHWSFGQFSAAGTRRQRAQGIEDTAQAHYDDVMRIGRGMATPHLVRLATEHAGPMVDWLEDIGFPFDEQCPAIVLGHEPYSTARTYWASGPAMDGGKGILRTLRRRLDEVAGGSARLDVLLETAMVGLVYEDGPAGRAVAGVVVEDAGGRRELRARRTLLTTGGYAAARDLLPHLQPRYASALTGCRPTSTGDLHRLLRRDLGVQMVGSEVYVPTMGLIEDPAAPGFGFPLHRQRVIVDAHQRRPWEVWVNRGGERFVAEDVRSPDVREHALMAQPDLAMAVVWDDQVMQAAPAVIGPDWSAQDVQRAAEDSGWLHRADTLAELAWWLEVDPAGLERSVSRYNDDLNAGRPDAWGRQHRPVELVRAPFYGVVSRGGMLLSRGGPAVDDQLRPLDAAGRPLLGCRVVGEALGMTQFSGDAFAGGMSVGPALSLGRWAVQEVARTLA